MQCCQSKVSSGVEKLGGTIELEHNSMKIRWGTKKRHLKMIKCCFSTMTLKIRGKYCWLPVLLWIMSVTDLFTSTITLIFYFSFIFFFFCCWRYFICLIWLTHAVWWCTHTRTHTHTHTKNPISYFIRFCQGRPSQTLNNGPVDFKKSN